jgi:hypothetical protein
MAEVFSLLLAGGALLVFCLAVPAFRGAGRRRTPVPIRRERPAPLGRPAAARPEGGHLLGRHDDRRCPR